MALFSFYNQRKPRQFDHKPLYWDPRKEASEARISRIKREMGLEESLEEYRPNVKGTFVEGTSHLKKSQMKGDTANTRVSRIIKLAVAAVLLIILFKYLFMP